MGGAGAGACFDARDRAIGEHIPLERCAEVEGDARFEVGLVEAGEELIRVGGDEEGVEVIAAVGVVRFDDAGTAGGDVGDEGELEGVFGVEERGGGDADVIAVEGGRVDGVPVGAQGGDASAAEVDDDVAGAFAHEADGDVAEG